MTSGDEIQLSAQILEQTLPEVQGELSVSIQYFYLWQSM